MLQPETIKIEPASHPYSVVLNTYFRRDVAPDLLYIQALNENKEP
jgi:hypothetical protein